MKKVKDKDWIIRGIGTKIPKYQPQQSTIKKWVKTLRRRLK